MQTSLAARNAVLKFFGNHEHGALILCTSNSLSHTHKEKKDLR